MTVLLDSFLDQLDPGPLVPLGPVHLLPLRGKPQGGPVALLDPHTAEVQEKARAQVGEVVVQNLSMLPLLLLSGELLKGARQNRLVNASTLVAPAARQPLKVSCVEQGRWAFRGSRGFSATEKTVPWSLRSRSSRSSSRSKRRRGVSEADQSAVWTEVTHRLQRRSLHSATGDLAAEVDPVDVDALLRGWQPGPDDVGAALFVGGELVGLEAFGRPDTWRSAAKRVLSGVQLDAGGSDRPPEDADAQLRALMQAARALPKSETPGDGLGTEVHGEADEVHLLARTTSDALVHLRVTRDREASPPSRGTHPARQRRDGRRDFARWARLEMRRTGDPALSVDQRLLVTPARLHQRSVRRRGSVAALPLPHRIAGGLAAWPLSTSRVESALRAALDAAGVDPGLLAVLDPDGGLEGGSRGWLRLEPDGEGGLSALLCASHRRRDG